MRCFCWGVFVCNVIDFILSMQKSIKLAETKYWPLSVELESFSHIAMNCWCWARHRFEVTQVMSISYLQAINYSFFKCTASLREVVAKMPLCTRFSCVNHFGQLMSTLRTLHVIIIYSELLKYMPARAFKWRYVGVGNADYTKESNFHVIISIFKYSHKWSANWVKKKKLVKFLEAKKLTKMRKKQTIH